MSKTKYSGVYKNNKTGKFYYNIELGIDKITGKRIQAKKSKSFLGAPFNSAKEAYEEVVRIRNEFHKINGYSNYNITYGQFMEDIYLKYYKSSVEDSTWRNRKSNFNTIVERFKNTKLREITVLDCERYRTYLLSETGFSQSYASLIYGMFRKSLDYAVQLQFIPNNVSKRTKAIPKGKAYVEFWEKSEFEKVLTTFCLENYYEHFEFVMVWLYYVTGIRVSEGLALRWSNIDFKNKKMKVYYNLERLPEGRYNLKPYLKTDNGRRVISLDNTTIKILKRWKEVQKSQTALESFVMSYNGTPVHRSTVNKMINRHSELAGVKRIQAKGLRHSNASYLINEHNADILVISQRLGHSSPEITLKHYAHLWSKNDENIAEMIDGNIEINTALESNIIFTGNQYVGSFE